MSRIIYALWVLFVVAVVGLMLALIVSISTEQHAFDSRVYTVGNQVFEGTTLIGTCGGEPPAPASIPPDSDRVDVTWYPECPR